MARKSFSKYQQTEILGNQDYKCRLCHTRFSKNVHPQFDHIDGDHSNNSVENGQAICSNCHDAKSRKENQKRSVEKKNIGFVKRCPLCKHKTRWKDYDLEKEGVTEEDMKVIGKSEYMLADHQFTCGGCRSRLKVLRLDPKHPKKSSGKKYQDVVKYCPACGVEFNTPQSSNTNMKCEQCSSKFSVWIKEYKKKGWFS